MCIANRPTRSTVHFRGAIARMLLAACLLGLMTSKVVSACPFCTAVSQTFAEEIETMEIAIFADLIEAADPTEFDPETGEMPRSKFKIREVIKGDKWVQPGETVEIHYFGTPEMDKQYFITATETPEVSWGSPVAITDKVYDYIQVAMELPAGYERLTFFLPYLEDEEEILRRDAYDEFAKTPYEGIIALEGSMDREQLKSWIQNPDVSVMHRRLYLTMLGVCGEAEDADFLGEFMKSDDKQEKAGLNALIACYLSLKGEAGLPLVKELFLSNEDARYEDTYSAIMALRFHGNESDKIPRDQLLEGMRAVLNRPDLADLVIPDLARWEDWSAVNQLRQLFIDADEESNWLRVPVINYLKACPLPAAEQVLEELADIDPEAIERAAAFFPYSQFSGPDRSESDDEEDTPALDEATQTAPRSDDPNELVDLFPAAEEVTNKRPAPRYLWWGLPVLGALVMGTVLLLGKTTR